MPETIPIDRDGLRVTLSAGDEVDLRLPFENEGDSPCAYTGRVEGPGAAFATPESGRIALGGHSRGAFVARFAAPMAGDYEVTLSVFEEEYLTEPLRSRKVAMVVKAAIPVEPPPPVEEPPAPETKPDPVKSPIPFTEPVPEESRAPVENPGVAVGPLKSVPPVEEAETKKARVVIETPAPEPMATPIPAEPVVVSFKREPTSAPAPAPDPKPKVEAKPRTVVEMGEAAPANEPVSAPARRTPVYDAKSYAPSVLRSPKTGDVLELAPGGKALVLLEFENKGQDEATYVLMVKDDLRPAEDFAYARTLMEQVNIRPGGTDELAFEIRIPEDAPPQTLRLRVSFGRRDGGRELEVTRLTLKVSPRIAVGLAAAKPKVVVGPLNRTPELALEVSNAGNVDTAYRLTAKGTSDVDADALPGEYPNLEARDGCHYLFDKEIEDVRQKGNVHAHLRFFRPGIWWLGWWQNARVKAVAVPVTDPRNARRSGNDVDLVATRWRLLPLPWFLALPLLLLFFVLFLGGFGVADVRVENALLSDQKLLFVLQPSSEFKDDASKPVVPIKANLAWSAPALSWLKIVAHGEGAEERRTGSRSSTITERVTGYDLLDSYRVTSPLGLGGEDSNRVVFLPLRTKEAFFLTPRFGLGDRGLPLPLHKDDPSATKFFTYSDNVEREYKGRKLTVDELNITVGPTDKVDIDATNEGKDNQVNVWRLADPKDYGLIGIESGKAQNIQAGKTKGVHWVLQPRASISPDGTDDCWFLTTDFGNQVMHIIINRKSEAAR